VSPKIDLFKQGSQSVICLIYNFLLIVFFTAKGFVGAVLGVLLISNATLGSVINQPKVGQHNVNFIKRTKRGQTILKVMFSILSHMKAFGYHLYCN
jgi:hypothetical protein